MSLTRTDLRPGDRDKAINAALEGMSDQAVYELENAGIYHQEGYLVFVEKPAAWVIVTLDSLEFQFLPLFMSSASREAVLEFMADIQQAYSYGHDDGQIQAKNEFRAWLKLPPIDDEDL